MIAVGSPPVDLAKEGFPECSFVKKHEMCDFYPERGTLARPDRNSRSSASLDTLANEPMDLPVDQAPYF